MLRLGLVLLVVPCFALMAGFMYEQSHINDCLSAGGSFNYHQMICDMQNKHPFIPFSQRHSFSVNGGMLVAVLGMLTCIVGLYKKR